MALPPHINQVRQRSLPTTLGAQVWVGGTSRIAQAVTAGGGHKIKITTPQQLPPSSSSGSSKGGQVGSDVAPLGSSITRMQINTTEVEVVARPTHRQGREPALRPKLHSSIPPNHRDLLAVQDISPDEDGSAGTAPARSAWRGKGDEGPPAATPQAALSGGAGG